MLEVEAFLEKPPKGDALALEEYSVSARSAIAPISSI